MSDSAAVLDQMLALGLDEPPLPLDLSGKLRRYGPKKRYWYKFNEQRSNAGRYVISGAFGDWKQGVSDRVRMSSAAYTEAERAAFAAQRAAQEAAARSERARESARAAMSASELWREGSNTGASDYLKRKLVDGEACRYIADGSLLVPLLRYDLPREEALRAIQRIWPDGTKRFTRGFEKPGCCLRLGHVVVGQPMLVAEGYATALTLRMAVAKRLPVFVALDAGNLPPVVELLRQLYPTSPLLVCADDDWRTKGNPGRAKAWAAARAVDQATVTYPIFRPAMRQAKQTDFNDLHAAEGLGMVRRQLRMVLPMLGAIDEPQDGAQRAA